MSYDPGKQKTAMYTAYLSTSSSSLGVAQGENGYKEFLFDTVTGACNINSNGKIECDHDHSITTCDISTAGTSWNIFNYGFTNSDYRTASHIRNEYAKGDDCAVGVHTNTSIIRVDTGVFYRMSGSRNPNGLDQLAGVII